MARTPRSSDPLPDYASPEPGRLVGRGHPAGDVLEAWDWTIVEERAGLLRVRAHLPERVRNSRGELFGGFGPVYVDFVAIAVLRAGEHAGPARSRFATVNMRVDYFEPVVGPAFEIESRIVKRRGRTALVETHVLDRGEIAIFALTTVREFAEEKEA